MPRGKRVLDLGAEGRPVITGGGFLRWADIAPPEDVAGFPFDIPAFRRLERMLSLLLAEAEE